MEGKHSEEAHGQTVDDAASTKAKEPLEQALCKELGLRLAWVLTVDHPRVHGASARLDALQLAPVKCVTKRGHRRRRRGRAEPYELHMSLESVNVEVGEED